MKKVLTILSIALSSVAFAGGEVKEVCRDRVDKAGKPVLDKKTNKPFRDCKKIKVHKKLEGTEVPVKK
jgi:hypothetical protein